MMKCEICEEYRIVEVMNVVKAGFLGGEDESKEVDICDDCYDRVSEMKEKGMIAMNRQSVCDVLNSLEVIEKQGGEDAYILVANNNENRTKLNAVGVFSDILGKYGDEEHFCILALAFGEGYADEYSIEKGFFLWEPLVDDELRYKVLNGEGKATDAERLLKALDEANKKLAAVKQALLAGPQPCPGGVTAEQYNADLLSVMPFLEECEPSE